MEGDGDSSTASLDEKTSESFGDNPTKDVLAEGIVGLLKPTVDQLEERIRLTRTSQVELSKQLEGLLEDLRKISEKTNCNVDLDAYVKRLVQTKNRVTVVNNILQTVQDRLNRLNQGIAKEGSRRKAFVEPSPVTSPVTPAVIPNT